MMIRPMDTYITVKRSATITDGPTLQQGTRNFTATLVTIEYVWQNQGWRATDIAFHGPVAKKDGSESRITSSRTYWATGECPEWVRKTVAQLKLSGTPYADDSRFEIRNPAQEA